MRMLGFVVGAGLVALAIGVSMSNRGLMLQRTATAPVDVGQPPAPAVDAAAPAQPEENPAVELAAFAPLADIETVAPADTAPAPVDEPPGVTVYPLNRPAEHASAPQAFAASPSDAAATSGPQASDLRWQAFWGPFNTRASAQGFARQIAQKTELDIQTLETDHGYMVAYPYASDAQRLVAKTVIEQRTGLALKLR